MSFNNFTTNNDNFDHEQYIKIQYQKDIIISALLQFFCRTISRNNHNVYLIILSTIWHILSNLGIVKSDIIDHKNDREREIFVNSLENIVENVLFSNKITNSNNNNSIINFNSSHHNNYNTKFDDIINNISFGFTYNRNIFHNFKINNIIGSGSFGTVYEITSLIDNCDYALKKTIYSKNYRKWNIEANILSKLNHPNIVRYHSSWLDFDINIDSKYSDLCTYLQLELCDTDLSSLLNIFTLNERLEYISTIFRQILLGVRYLHNMNIIHRDLKPSNILIKFKDDTYLVKLSDFGCSKIVVNDIQFELPTNNNTSNELYYVKNVMSDSVVGTAIYAAPEINLNNFNSLSSDIYSLGVILSELFINESDQDKRITLLKSLPNTDYQYINNLICIMTNNDYTKRPNITNILKIWNNRYKSIKINQ